MINSLRIVRPIAIEPAMLIASNVPEADYPAWSAGTTYAAGVRVMRPAEHKVYQSVAAGNVGNVPESSPAAWIEVGPTNRWKVFDQSNSTQTKQAGVISYQIRPGQAVHSIAALNLIGATHIRIRVVDPLLGTIYDKTTALAGQLIYSTWWDWFFGERTAPRQTVHTDLPSAPAADIYIDLTGTDELAVGVIMLGTMRRFAVGVKLGARVGIQDFSRKEKNEFGDTILVERAFARRASFALALRASEVDALMEFLADIRATPCLWIGSSRYEATTVYGIYRNFEILISYFDYSDCELELEGLT